MSPYSAHTSERPFLLDLLGKRPLQEGVRHAPRDLLERHGEAVNESAAEPAIDLAVQRLHAGHVSWKVDQAHDKPKPRLWQRSHPGVFIVSQHREAILDDLCEGWNAQETQGLTHQLVLIQFVVVQHLTSGMGGLVSLVLGLHPVDELLRVAHLRQRLEEEALPLLLECGDLIRNVRAVLLQSLDAPHNQPLLAVQQFHHYRWISRGQACIGPEIEHAVAEIAPADLIFLCLRPISRRHAPQISLGELAHFLR
mmetsp:Transcript_15186/g.43409  ORF Transcript_15186/g.43409 Transcript_15186/m.43409 type:complete len:253 (-) Transcript_15186:1051-1809(-)